MHINVGTGEALTIRDLPGLIRDVVHPGAIMTVDPSRPDGMPRKLLDVSRIHGLGWHHRKGLADGLRSTYAWFLAHRESLSASPIPNE
jgi:GDP-L-fucose synthase